MRVRFSVGWKHQFCTEVMQLEGGDSIGRKARTGFVIFALSAESCWRSFRDLLRFSEGVLLIEKRKENILDISACWRMPVLFLN